MAFCTNCGQELAEGAKFCGNCGKAVSDSNSNVQRKTVYDGEIHKCPNCGEALKSFELMCPTCGHEMRGTKVSSSVQLFAAELYKATTTEQRVQTIRNFPIPNTKEDILEFLILASSNIKQIDERLAQAWSAKLDQIYQKASLTFASDPAFSEIQEKYAKATKQLQANKKVVATKSMANKVLNILITCPGLILIAVGVLLSEYDDMSIPLILLGGVTLAIMAVYHTRRGMIPASVGSGIITIGVALLLDEYDDRRVVLLLVGSLVFLVLAITFAKNKKKH